MADTRKPYVKIWAAETLLSDDMNSLSDHEERVFFRLMLVASLEETRWITRDTPGLHRKCLTTGPKFARVVARLEALGMVERLSDGRLFVVNGHRWNEQTDRAKAPSDSPEATRQRQSRARALKRHESVTTRDSEASRAHIEKEKEKEAEAEVALVTASAPAAALEDLEISETDLAVGRLCRSWENATSTTVTAALGEKLADWLETLPEAAIVKAISETGAGGARNWRYCEAILRRYQAEGWADRPPPRTSPVALIESPPPTADQVEEWIRNRPERYPGGIAQ